MPRVILKTDQTTSETLDESVEGYYQLDCSPFGEAVKMQYSNDRGQTWVDAYAPTGSLIQFESEGIILDMEFTRERYYRFVTGSAGSQITMDKHYQAGRS